MMLVCHHRPMSGPSLSIATAMVWLCAAVTAASGQPVPSGSPGQSTSDASEAAQGSVEAQLRIAFGLYSANNYPAAGDQFRAALRIARDQHNQLAEAEAHRGLGLIAFEKAQYEQARVELDEAMAGFTALGNRLGIVRTTRHLGSVALMSGDQPAARAAYDKAVSIADEDGLLEEKARSLADRSYAGGLSRDDRLAMTTEALRLSRTLGLRVLEGRMLHSNGDMLFSGGEFAAAQEKLDEAAAVFEQAGARSELARVLTSQGRLYRAHGQGDRALDFYRRAFAIQEEVGDRQGAIQSVNAIATALDVRGQHKEALEQYKRGLALAEQTGSPRMINFMRGNLGGSYLALGDYARARELLEAVAREPMDPYIAAFRYDQLSGTYLGLKQYAEALEAAEHAVAVVRDAGDTERLPAALFSRAAAHRAQGRLRDAVVDTRELLTAIEQLRSGLAPSDFMKRGFGDWWENAFAFAVQLYQQLGEHEQAIEIAEAARARAFVDLLATRDVRGKPADRERLTELRRLETELRTAGVDLAAAPVNAAQLTYRGESSLAAPSPLWRRWRTADPELRSFIAAEPLSIQQMVTTARRLQSTLLTYWVGSDETFIGVVRPDGTVRTATVAVTARRLAELARATQPDVQNGRGAPAIDQAGEKEGVEEPRAGARGEWLPRARGDDLVAMASGGKAARRELYRVLIAPIVDLLPRERGALLTIIPHGALFSVSFAALIDDHDRYLVERFTVHYAPSGAVLQFTERKKQKAASQTYLLVGDPADLPALQDGKALPRLPGSRQEVAAIARTLRGRDVLLLTGSSAGEDQVRASMAGKSVLHFATHGIVRDDEPFESFVALGRGGPAASVDGRLTAREVYDLDLRADLVILSACRTGAGRVTGDGIIGLTRAFLYAGTPTVIATLWDIADEPALFLLPRLYAAIDAGKDKARALRDAQLKLLVDLRAGRVRVNGPLGWVTLPEDPLFWAGFVLVGEP
jgi:CHAT domain-containing protein/tetratricopeptide (TPR) repeat protein